MIPLMTDFDANVAWFVSQGEARLGDIEAALSHIGRNDGPALVFDLWAGDLLSVEAATSVVAAVWSAAEFPERNLDRESWLALFDLAGYTDDGEAADRPNSSLILYRGADEASRLGWSWTDDLTVARWFAESTSRGRPRGRVWTADVEPWRLLARIHQASRGESEYVVDTDDLAVSELPAVANAVATPSQQG